MILSKHAKSLYGVNPVKLAQLLYSRYCIVEDHILDGMESITVPLEQRQDNLVNDLLAGVKVCHQNLLLLANLLPELTIDKSLSDQLLKEYGNIIIFSFKHYFF